MNQFHMEKSIPKITRFDGGRLTKIWKCTAFSLVAHPTFIKRHSMVRVQRKLEVRDFFRFCAPYHQKTAFYGWRLAKILKYDIFLGCILKTAFDGGGPAKIQKHRTFSYTPSKIRDLHPRAAPPSFCLGALLIS